MQTRHPPHYWDKMGWASGITGEKTTTIDVITGQGNT